MRVDVLSLNILPDAVLVSSVSPLCMKELQQMLLLLCTQLAKNSMRREGAEIFQDASNFLVFRFQNYMQVGGHDNKGKEKYPFLLL